MCHNKTLALILFFLVNMLSFNEKLFSSYEHAVVYCNAELQSQHDRQMEEITERFELIKVSLSVSFVFYYI